MCGMANVVPFHCHPSGPRLTVSAQIQLLTNIHPRKGPPPVGARDEAFEINLFSRRCQCGRRSASLPTLFMFSTRCPVLPLPFTLPFISCPGYERWRNLLDERGLGPRCREGGGREALRICVAQGCWVLGWPAVGSPNPELPFIFSLLPSTALSLAGSLRTGAPPQCCGLRPGPAGR